MQSAFAYNRKKRLVYDIFAVFEDISQRCTEAAKTNDCTIYWNKALMLVGIDTRKSCECQRMKYVSCQVRWRENFLWQMMMNTKISSFFRAFFFCSLKNKLGVQAEEIVFWVRNLLSHGNRTVYLLTRSW